MINADNSKFMRAIPIRAMGGVTGGGFDILNADY